ncbi:MAG TPA: hypothetical protein VGG42_07745 [Acidobacteriaceae bacterium]|jgi:hypothetical protein
MNANFACQNAPSSAIRLGSFRHMTNRCGKALLALLALLCGLGASVQAQTASYSGSTSVFDATDFLGPQGIATDASGDLFFADAFTETVYERARTGAGVYSSPVALPNPTPGYVFLRGIAIDSNGNLWVADNANGSGGQVYELVNTAGSFAAPAKVGTGVWTAPWGVTADASGNVFVADNGAQSIMEISGGTITLTVPNSTSQITAPRGIAVDSAEDLFVVDGNLGTVLKLSPPYTSAAVAINATAFQGPGDIALDASGNIWVAAYSTSLIRELTASSDYATILNWGSGLSGPVAVWPDADGAILVSSYANGNNGSIAQIDTGVVNVGTVAVGSSSATQSLAFTFNSAGSIAAPAVLTQGGANVDFIDAGTGTCTTNGIAHSYAQGDTCTVDVKLNPKHPGARNGAVELRNGSGTVLTTAFIYGTGSGPQVVFPSNTATQSLGTGGFNSPFGVALDASGNIYVADLSDVVEKMPPGCADSSCVTTLGGGFSSSTGVAVDGAGNVYVADAYPTNTIDRIPPGCTTAGCVTTLGGGFSAPIRVAVDGSGNVYVADQSDTVEEMPPGCADSTCVTPLGGGFSSSTGVALDSAGNVYVAGANAVYKMPPACGTATCVTTLANGFNQPEGLAVDAAGNVYVADSGNAAVKEIPVGCSSSACVVTLGGNHPNDVALDASGNAYTAGFISQVEEINLSSPPSLSFATTSGGSQSSDSPQAVTVGNIGNAALTFPVPGTGTNPSVSANFTLDGSTTCPQVTTSSSAGSLAAGASCSLAVDFIPTTSGQISGSVVLSDNSLNASNGMQSIGLNGSGVTPVFGYEETAQDASNHSTTLPQSDSLVVSGWAADQQDGAPVQQVAVLIDGTAVGNATLGGSRPDVANAYHNPSYTNSGWNFTYPASGLSGGTHTVTAMAYDSQGLSARLVGTKTITVNALPPFGSEEAAQDTKTHSSTVAQSDSLVVSGWAADVQEGAPVHQVTILIDGAAVGNATLGGSRPDVATAYNNSAFTNSGWTFTYGASVLSGGTHTVTAIAYDTQGLSTQLPGAKTITVQALGPLGSEESVRGATSHSATVPQSDSLVVTGWAADWHQGSPVSQVSILIDGTAVGNATLGVSRTDVAAVYNNSAFTNSGWTFTYAASGLSGGTHTVTAVASDNQSLSTQWSKTFTVQAIGPSGSEESARGATSHSATVPQSDSLVVTGWAADWHQGSPVSQVSILIDGTVVGNATLGGSRPDVAATYNNSAFTNSGWTFTYAASGLSGGTHTVTAVASDNQSLSTQWSKTITVTATAPLGNEDAAQGATSHSVTVPQSDNLVVTGWAADWHQGSPVSRVSILIDGTAVGNATLGVSRTDVAAAYNNSAFTNSGWTFTYAASGLSGGSHTVTAIAYDNQNLSAQLPGAKTITVTALAPLGKEESAQGATSHSATVAQSDSVVVTGWAADWHQGSPVSRVSILIDGTAVGNATLGGSRPDVAAAYNNSAFTNSGWTFTHAASGLSVGTHTVTAIVYDNQSQSTQLSAAKTITVTRGGS